MVFFFFLIDYIFIYQRFLFIPGMKLGLSLGLFYKQTVKHSSALHEV